MIVISTHIAQMGAFYYYCKSVLLLNRCTNLMTDGGGTSVTLRQQIQRARRERGNTKKQRKAR